MALSDSDLSQPTLDVALLAFFDFMDGATPDPVRVALAKCAINVPAALTGDSDCDNHSFGLVDPNLISVGPVTHGEGGTETVTLTASATVAGDSDLLNQLAVAANFRGRIAKLWIALVEGATVVSARPYYTGQMAVPTIAFEPNSQTLGLSIENYLNVLASGPPSRTLLSQRNYDSGDLSGDATLSAANGAASSGADVGIGNTLSGYAMANDL